MPTPSFILPTSVPVVDASVEALRVYDGSPAGFDVLPMSFTRGSSATRTDSAGNIVSAVPYNLLTYSETFDNAAWVKTGTTITPNTTTAPNGTLTADTMSIADNNSRVLQAVTLGAGTYTFSAYVKILSQTTAGTIRLQAVVDGIIVSTVFTATTEWQRVTGTFTAATGITSILIRGSVFVGDIAIWGVQLVEGTEPLPYQETVTRLALPRLDYRNADGTLSSTPRLLLEPQRTNLALFSDQLDNAAWTKVAVSVTANATTSPDGTTNADAITANGVTTPHNFFQIIASGTIKSISIYAKAGTHQFLQILTGGTSAPVANYDLVNGTSNMIGSSSTSFIEDVGNGWYRCILSTTDTGASNPTFAFAASLSSARNPPISTSGTIFIWGVQVENAAYTTTYIPTTTAAVTRLADACSVTGVADLIGQTEGTLFVDIELPPLVGTTSNLISLGGPSQPRIYIVKENASTNVYQLGIQNAAGTYNFVNTSAITTPRIKFAIGYATGNNAFYVNGSLISTASANANATNLSSITLGPNSANVHQYQINKAALYTTRLSNSELQSLTTL